MARDLFRQANALWDRGKLDEAIATLHEALAADPTQGREWARLGLLLEECGELEEAVWCFRKGSNLRPFDDIVTGVFVFALERSGRHRAARNEAMRFLRLVDEMHIPIGADMHDDFVAIINKARAS